MLRDSRQTIIYVAAAVAVAVVVAAAVAALGLYSHLHQDRLNCVRYVEQ